MGMVAAARAWVEEERGSAAAVRAEEVAPADALVRAAARGMAIKAGCRAEGRTEATDGLVAVEEGPRAATAAMVVVLLVEVAAESVGTVAVVVVMAMGSVLRNLCNLSRMHSRRSGGPHLHHRSSYLSQSRLRRRTRRCIGSQAGVAVAVLVVGRAAVVLVVGRAVAARAWEEVAMELAEGVKAETDSVREPSGAGAETVVVIVAAVGRERANWVAALVAVVAWAAVARGMAKEGG